MSADEYAPKGWDEAATIMVKSETPSTIVGFAHCEQCGSRELERIVSEGCVSIKCCGEEKMRPAVTIAVKRNLDPRQAAEIELWELPGGKLSVRLLGVCVGFADDVAEAISLPRVREFLEEHNSPLGVPPEKSTAVLVRDGVAVAQTSTSARGGELVEVSFAQTFGVARVSGGVAKVSRNRRYLGDDELLEALPHAVVCKLGTSIVV